MALTFMTRLGRARIWDDAALAHMMCCFAPVGLVVGLVCTIPLWLAYAMGFTAAWPLAWVYVLLDLWVTRGLHYDGVADLGDAWGSGAQGDRFWEILRDSRLGAFGAMALFLALSGLLLAAQQRVAAEQWLVLVVAPAYGRALCVVLAHAAAPHDPLSLGGKACAGATRRAAVAHVLVCVLLVLTAVWTLPVLSAPVVLVCSVCWVWLLQCLAARCGGSNGDFLGASIVGGQVIFMLFL